MRIGIIGTGRHGSRYANHILNDVHGMELAAISRRSPEGAAQAKNWQCNLYPDWHDLVAAAEVEAVIAAVPPTLNLDIARACVATRKPLLLEKPLAAGAEDAREIVRICHQNDLPLTTGQTLRYNQVIRTFKKEFSRLGPLLGFSASQRLEPITHEWLKQPELAGAGVSFHTAVHVFDALRYISGQEIIRVMAWTDRPVIENRLLALLELENGATGTVDCSKISHSRSGRFEFIFDRAQLVGDQVHNTCACIRGMDRQKIDCGEVVSTIVPLLKEWLLFLSAQEGSKNPVSGADGLRAVQVAAACLESARSNRWVKVKDSRHP